MYYVLCGSNNLNPSFIFIPLKSDTVHGCHNDTKCKTTTSLDIRTLWKLILDVGKVICRDDQEQKLWGWRTWLKLKMQGADFCLWKSLFRSYEYETNLRCGNMEIQSLHSLRSCVGPFVLLSNRMRSTSSNNFCTLSEDSLSNSYQRQKWMMSQVNFSWILSTILSIGKHLQ